MHLQTNMNMSNGEPSLHESCLSRDTFNPLKVAVIIWTTVPKSLRTKSDGLIQMLWLQMH